jgi:hypothetical protein
MRDAIVVLANHFVEKMMIAEMAKLVKDKFVLLGADRTLVALIA